MFFGILGFGTGLDWAGNFFVGGLAGTQMARLTPGDSGFGNEETLVNAIGRVRDIRQGPDGYIYLAIDDGGGLRSILHMVPVKNDQN